MILRRPRALFLLAAGACGLAAAPLARAQLVPTDRFGRAVSDVQGYHLAGGGTFVEVDWPAYARFRTYEDQSPATVATIQAGRATAQDVELRSKTDRSIGAEARLSLVGVPWLFGTAEYRRARFGEFRIQGSDGTSGFQRIPNDGAAYIGIGGLGAGVAIPQTPFYARAEYSFIYASGLGLDRRYDGVAVFGGLNQPVLSWLGVRAEAGYQQYNSFGSGFAWRAGANLNLTPQVALTGTYRSFQLHQNNGVNARADDATVGLRFQFAQ